MSTTVCSQQVVYPPKLQFIKNLALLKKKISTHVDKSTLACFSEKGDSGLQEQSTVCCGYTINERNAEVSKKNREGYPRFHQTIISVAISAPLPFTFVVVAGIAKAAPQSDCVNRAGIEAYSTADTFILIDDIALAGLTGDCSLNRADFHAVATTIAFHIDIHLWPHANQIDKAFGGAFICRRHKIFVLGIIKLRQVVFHGNGARFGGLYAQCAGGAANRAIFFDLCPAIVI